MKQERLRLLVMNGQRLIQEELQDKPGQWETVKVSKANDIKAGIYNIHLSKVPDKKQEYNGLVLHIDDQLIYQQIEKNDYVKHDRTDFHKLPNIGKHSNIQYDNNGKAVVTELALGQKKGLSR
ncbi:MAG: conjugal transfer protein TraO [Methylococcales bacterium]|nr:conjugal transfer protein TraO [Methylococcales bacterium]